MQRNEPLTGRNLYHSLTPCVRHTGSGISKVVDVMGVHAIGASIISSRRHHRVREVVMFGMSERVPFERSLVRVLHHICWTVREIDVPNSSISHLSSRSERQQAFGVMCYTMLQSSSTATVLGSWLNHVDLMSGCQMREMFEQRIPARNRCFPPDGCILNGS